MRYCNSDVITNEVQDVLHTSTDMIIYWIHSVNQSNKQGQSHQLLKSKKQFKSIKIKSIKTAEQTGASPYSFAVFFHLNTTWNVFEQH